jgi:hypothetical protein
MMKTFKKILILVVIMVVALGFTGCRPYQKPIYEEVLPNEIAFLVPLEGDASKQGSLASSSFLEESLVLSKRVQIPTRWNQTGRMLSIGEWIPTHRLIKLNMAPITREWTPDTTTGTASTNQGFEAESSESIGFVTGITCTAQIGSQSNAIKFLSVYYGMTIDQILDTEVRNRVATLLVELYAKMTIEEIRNSKDKVIAEVRNNIIPYFESKGLTISTLGYKEALTYTSPEIQKAIDAKYVAEKNQQAQLIVNKTNAEKAKSDADIAELKAMSDAKIIKAQMDTLVQQIDLLKAQAQLKFAEAEMEKAKNWRPTVIGGNVQTQVAN